MKPIAYKDHLILPADNRVAVMVPHAKRFTDPDTGQEMFLVPHKVDETQVLRNLGYDVRPPVLTGYQWPGPEPFDAQRITTAHITTHKRCFVLNGLGTGKTRAALFAYDYLRMTKACPGKLLVVAPLSTLRQTWGRELTMYFPHLKYAVLHGAKAKRVALLDTDADVLIINHDGVETIIAELVARKQKFSMVVLDELSVYKNAKTDLWKATNRFCCEIDRVVGMTATPMTLAATDVYGQIKMIAPHQLQDRSFGRFRELLQNKVSQFRWVNKREATDIVFGMMKPAVRFTRDECYDMPPCQVVPVEVEMTQDQRKLISLIQTEAAIEHLNIKCANAADQINKSLQISLGVVYDQTGSEITIPAKPRYDALDAAIEQSASKVIVFTPYKSSLRHLVAHVSKTWSCEFVSGDVSPAQRERIFTMFTYSENPRVLIAHPDCMSHGLTLTEASTIVWWGPPQSLETYEQANGRITRAGQKHSQLIINLMSTKLEQQIFRLLERRANVQQALLDMFEAQDLGDLS